MNTLFGLAQPSNADGAAELPRHMQCPRRERGPFSGGQPEGSKMRWGSTSNGGAVLGRASDARRGLAYLGNVHAPFPDTGGSSPLDNPDETARALLDRYERLGPDFLRNVCGHFAVLVVEPEAGRIVLARGHGSAPRWFFDATSKRLAFSTRLADLVDLQGDSAALDRSHEDFLLGYEFLPHGRTPFKGVQTLLPGKLLEWSDGTITIHDIAAPSPWGARFDGIDYDDESSVVNALHDGFRQAIADQTPSTSKVAVLLGGVDSELVAVALKELGKDVHTFSFRYSDGSYNQPFTEQLADRFGLTHHWVPINARVIEEGLQNYAQRFNQTLSQPHYVIATAHVCQAIREAGILHALTGDGCDGLFLGYPTVHMRAKLIEGLSRAAPLLSRGIEIFTRSRWLERRLGHPYRIARNVGRILRRPMPIRGHVAACTLDATALDALRAGSSPEHGYDTEQILGELASGLEDMGTVRLAYLGKSRVGLNGVKLDAAMGQSGICLNSPYLHPGLERIAKRIPDSLNRPGRSTKAKSMGKYAFLQMIEKNRLLPAELVYQEKRSPVMAPVDEWYWGELRPFMLSQLQALPFPINQDYAESLLAPKLSERLFRTHVGISRYVTPAAALLATYASFAQLTRGHRLPEAGASQAHASSAA